MTDKTLSTLRKIRACEGETAAQIVFEHYIDLCRQAFIEEAVEVAEGELIHTCSPEDLAHNETVRGVQRALRNMK